MDDQKFQKLVEQGWRRPLREEELAQVRKIIANDPDAQAEWESERALNRCLDRLQNPAVSSNFTAQVLQRARTGVIRPVRPRGWLSKWFSPGLIPRLAFGALMVCVGLFSAREYEIAHRARMARDMATMSRLAALPPVEWLKNFDTINKMGRVEVADVELLAALR
jgi:hypothetical protein